MIEIRHTIWRLLACAGVCLALLGQAGPASAQIESDPSQLTPDIAVLAPDFDSNLSLELIPALRAIEGVARATVDTAGDGSTVFYLALTESGGITRPAGAVAGEAERIILDRAPDAELLVGGSVLVDRAVLGRFRTSAIAVGILAMALGLALGIVFGWKRALATAFALGLAVLCAASLGAQVGGTFDGTMATTSLPGALAALVAGVAIAVRLLLWFRTPRGVDGADIIRRSVTDMASELALAFSGLLVAAFAVELLNPGRSPLTVVVISGLVAVLVVLAVLAPSLTVLNGEPEGRSDLLPFSFPDGRDFPLLVLSAIAAVLVAFSLFAMRQPERSLIGFEALPDQEPSSVVATRLAAAGGDPTSALTAFKPEAATATDFKIWTEVVVERAEVAWVDTGSGRIRSTGAVEIDETAVLVPPGQPDVALIVLNTPPRSAERQELVARLGGIPLAGGQPIFEGDGAETSRLAGSRTTPILAVLALAIAAAAALYVLTENVANAAMAFLVRIIGGGATLGLSD